MMGVSNQKSEREVRKQRIQIRDKEDKRENGRKRKIEIENEKRDRESVRMR